MVTANNASIKLCKDFAKSNGWEKVGHRNVVIVNGEKWSFSVSEVRNYNVECRQCYEDTVGFISYVPSLNKVLYYRVSNMNNHYTVSRVTSKGVKAYNVLRHLNEMQPLAVSIPS